MEILVYIQICDDKICDIRTFESQDDLTIYLRNFLCLDNDIIEELLESMSYSDDNGLEYQIHQTILNGVE